MNKGYTVNFLESKQPFDDILIPAKHRKGYKDGENSVIPIYFYRYVGIAGHDGSIQDNYYNQIYQLHETLLKHPSGYLKLENTIAMPSHDEIQRAVEQVKKGNPTHFKSIKDMIVSQVVQSGTLAMFQSPIINETVITAFEQVMDLYFKTERNVNESKGENFALKLLVWLKRYQSYLFKESRFNDVPKVIFYGDIKQHEVYFLTLLALMGCDVLFIHTNKEKDNVFEEMNRYHDYSKKIEFAESCTLEDFPITERAMQMNTVAYDASKEIEGMLYGADVGLFKPWQYETGTTKPILLKTTYDELKILWDEKAKIRPGFEVKEDKVYVPTIFAKVNGTQAELMEYWEDVHTLAKADNTVLYKNAPFASKKYSNTDMYSTAFLFNDNGALDRDELYQSGVYKLTYLKSSIQELIVSKINELITSKLFIKEIDERMRLKILMTIITMDSELLRLIELFDFTGSIPKIMIYSGEKDEMNEEDSILLAFFHLIGADIVIFTPTNYRNIEQWIHPNYFSIHQLPSVQFEMVFKEEEFQISIRQERSNDLTFGIVIMAMVIMPIFVFIGHFIL